METPDFFDAEEPDTSPRQAPPRAPGPAPRPQPHRGLIFPAIGGQVGWVAGLALGLSSFTGWYTGSSLEGPPIAVIGWHTGTLGKLVFFVGLAVVLLAVLRVVGVGLPPSLPGSIVVAALGAVATIFVLVRLISIPDSIPDTASRGIGIWIALIAALAVIVGGLVQAAEEL